MSFFPSEVAFVKYWDGTWWKLRFCIKNMRLKEGALKFYITTLLTIQFQIVKQAFEEKTNWIKSWNQYSFLSIHFCKKEKKILSPSLTHSHTRARTQPRAHTSSK